MIFLNSAFRPLNQLFLGAFSVFAESPMLITPLPYPITSSLCASCVSYRICNTFWFPFCPDESSYPSSYCSYAACTPYMPMLFSYAQLPPPLDFFCGLFLQKVGWPVGHNFRHKKKTYFHSPDNYTIQHYNQSTPFSCFCRSFRDFLYFL